MSPHHQASIAAPTPTQLSYLRSLAAQTATTFAVPRTGAQASREIQRMKALKSRGMLDPEPRGGSDAAEAPYATAVDDSEVEGYGSSTTWRVRGGTAAATRSTPRVGELTELARYETREGERVLYGQRVDGTVRITDRPATGPGRSYLVERGLEQDGYAALKALIADYTAQARELGAIPMATSAMAVQVNESAGG